MRNRLVSLSALAAALALSLAFAGEPAGKEAGKSAEPKAVQKEAIAAGKAEAPCAKKDADGYTCLRKQGAAKAQASADADCPRGAEDCPPDCDRADCLKKAEGKGAAPAKDAATDI